MNDAREQFADHGLRCTRQRIAIYEALRASTAHPTAEELFAVVSRDCEGVSLATVYNALEALCDAGLCRRLPVVQGSTRYDGRVQPHMHVIDASTGRYMDVPDDLGSELLSSVPREVIERIEERLGVKIERVSLQLVSSSALEPKATV